jgi:oxalate---CoA ligase
MSRYRGDHSIGPYAMSASVYELLQERAALTPDAAALLAPEREPLSYAGLLRQVTRLGRALAAQGVTHGDRVAVVLENGPEMAASFIGIASVATCAPLNPAYGAREFEHYLDDLRPRIVIVGAGLESPVRTVAAARGIAIVELEPDIARPAGVFTLNDRPRPAPSAEPGFAGPDDIALVLHTSGTTSRPKMVPLSNRNLCSSAATIARSLRLTAADRCLNVMPLFHIHGLIGAVLSTLSSGGSVVCLPGFRAPPFFDWLSTFAPTWYTAVPTIHRDVLARATQLPQPIGPTSLRFVRSCSAPMPPQLIADVEACFGIPLVEAYGMTEASHQIACNPLPPGRRKPGSVGLPTGTEVTAMAEDGTLLGPEQPGEIVVKGAGLTAGYAGNPEANAAAFADGWFRTGDQGHIDRDGYVFLTGRSKEIINRGGTKISPREIDDVLTAHPAVAAAVAFAVPNDRLGEEVGAAIVLRRGATADAQELRAFAAGRLSAFKVPRRIVFLDELPKGATGKLQRIGLAEKLGIADGGEPVPSSGGEAVFVAPRTPAEERLAALWRRVLRVERIGVRDNFFDRGGDSLSAVMLIAEIENGFGVALAVASLFDAPSIEELAALVEASAGAAVRPRLARIRPLGERPPFLCIGAGPTMLPLARRLSGQPFLSPQYPDFGQVPHPCRVEDIAAFHVATIRAEFPSGPYFLGGWCMDGIVAYEVAQQLRAQGETVGLVALFDVPNPAPAENEAAAHRMMAALDELARMVRLHAGAVSRLGWRGGLADFRGRLSNIAHRVNRKLVQLRYVLSLRLNIPATDGDWLAIQHRACMRYRFAPIDVPLLVLRRTVRTGGRYRDAKAGWDVLARGGLTVEEIRGDHDDMFLEPEVATTAEILDSALIGAQAALWPRPRSQSAA